MYSPKIYEDLVPKLYKMRIAQNKPMTKIVDSILRKYLENIVIAEEQAEITTTGTVYRIIDNNTP